MIHAILVALAVFLPGLLVLVIMANRDEKRRKLKERNREISWQADENWRNRNRTPK